MIRRGLLLVWCIAIAVAGMSSCRTAPEPEHAADTNPWRYLFNGEDLTGWDAPMSNWVAEDGVLA